MTQQNQIEIIRKQFPDTGEVEIRKRLNSANKYFIRESRIIQDTISFKVIDGQTDYKFSQLTRPGGGQLMEVISVEDDKDFNSNFVWIVEDRDTLIIGDYKGNDLIGPAKAGSVIHVVGVFTDPGYGSDLTSEPAYDEEFHMAIVFRVLADLYLEVGEMNRWSAYRKEYKDLEIAAKKAAGSAGIKGNYRIFNGIDPYSN